MGTTGSSDKVAVNSQLPDIVARIKEYATVPLAVGFGVSTREHFNVVVDAGAEGVVVGSRLVSVIKDAPLGQIATKVEEYCRSISLKGQPPQDKHRSPPNGTRQVTKSAAQSANHTKPVAPSSTSDTNVLPARFGQFGGQYVPEALFDCLIELEQAHKSAMADPEFWKEWEGLFKYMNRPSNLYFAEKLTEHASGAKIWMKREDLFVHSPTSPLLVSRLFSNHTGSHKINNAIGQILLARRIGKTRIIAETGAGQHGVATATVCARFGLECVIYMGAEDVRRQALNVFRIEMLGAKVPTLKAVSLSHPDVSNSGHTRPVRLTHAKGCSQ